MYFGYGWPRIIASEAVSAGEECIYACLDHAYLVVVTRKAVELWTGGHHRIRIGYAELLADQPGREQVAACWSSAQSALAVLSSDNQLHICGVRGTHKPAPPAAGAAVVLQAKRVELQVQHSVQLTPDALATALCCNGRAVIVGFDDATLAAYSWTGKELEDVCDPLGEELDELEAQVMMEQGGGVPPQPHAPHHHHAAGAGVSANGGGDAAAASLAAGLDGAGGGPRLPVGRSAIRRLHFCRRANALALLMADGSVAVCSTPEGDLLPLSQHEFSHWVCGPEAGATHVSLSAQGQLAAVGTQGGVVRLYTLQPASAGAAHAAPAASLVRSLCLDEWGYKPADLGAVSALRWAPDGSALAVGYARQGVVVWTPSGCRLLCTLREGGGLAPPAATPDGGSLLASGISCLAWGGLGYQLVAVEAGPEPHLAELQFARSLPGHHRVGAVGRTEGGGRAGHTPGEVHTLQAHDRLLLIAEAVQGQVQGSLLSVGVNGPEGAEPSGASQLTVQHVALPTAYLTSNWPLVHAAVSPCGVDVAAAGPHGLALYSRASERWRLFGDVSQEKQVAAMALAWLGASVVVCSAPVGELVGSGGGGGGGGAPPACQLLLFPKHHLDFSSLVAVHDLPQVPTAMDCVGNHILLASEPLQLVVLELQALPGAVPAVGGVGEAEAAEAVPRQCVVLRWGGLLSVLDMEAGSELELSQQVETFWLSDTLPVAPPPLPLQRSFSATALQLASQRLQLHRPAGDAGSALDIWKGEPLAVEMPWWAYGPRGMQLWFPSLLPSPSAVNPVSSPHAYLGHQPFSPSGSTASTAAQGWSVRSEKEAVAHAGAWGGVNDPELEFENEVYPIGISLADAAVVGAKQRLMRTDRLQVEAQDVQLGPSVPFLSPLPSSQPVLSCLLRRLLQQGALAEAAALARRHASGPHFGRSLEWTLFTTLDQEPSHPAASKTSYGKYPAPSPPGALPVGGGGKAWRASPSPSAQPLPTLPAPISPLLSAAAELVLHFPQAADVVVSVARKTDASLWPALFTAVGSPSALWEHLLASGALTAAACFLLVVDRVEGTRLAHAMALRLVRATLRRSQPFLAAEVLRFMAPPDEISSPDFSARVAAASAAAWGLAAAPTRAAAAGGSSNGPVRLPQQQQQQQQQRALPPRPVKAESTMSPLSPAASVDSTSRQRMRALCMPVGLEGARSGGGGGEAAPPPPWELEVAPEPQKGWLEWLWGGGDAAGGERGAAPSSVDARPWPPPSLANGAAGPFSVAPSPSGARQAAAGASAVAPASARAPRSRALALLDGTTPSSASGSGAGSGAGVKQRGGAGLGSAMHAFQEVADAGWVMVEEGKLAVLAQLIHAMSFLHGGLAGLMGAYLAAFTPLAAATANGAPPNGAEAGGEAEAADLVAALRVAMAELPVWEGPAVKQDAAAVQECAQQLGLTRWEVALALLLEDVSPLAPFRTRHPAQWDALWALLLADKEFFFLHDIGAALRGGDFDGTSSGGGVGE